MVLAVEWFIPFNQGAKRKKDQARPKQDGSKTDAIGKYLQSGIEQDESKTEVRRKQDESETKAR